MKPAMKPGTFWGGHETTHETGVLNAPHETTHETTHETGSGFMALKKNLPYIYILVYMPL